MIGGNIDVIRCYSPIRNMRYLIELSGGARRQLFFADRLQKGEKFRIVRNFSATEDRTNLRKWTGELCVCCSRFGSVSLRGASAKQWLITTSGVCGEVYEAINRSQVPVASCRRLLVLRSF